MNWVTVTKALVLAGVAFYVLYDLFAFLAGGVEATESDVVGTWMRASPWVTLLVFLLAGHLLACGPGPITWKHVAAAALGLAAGYVCTAG